MREANLPSIPSIADRNLVDAARAVKQILDVREGRVGDPLDANVTFRNLMDAGIASQNLTFVGWGSGLPIGPVGGAASGYNPSADLAIPPAPEGFSATGAFATVILEWNSLPPSYKNHAYAEIWRSETNVLGNAVMIGTTVASIYTDNVGTSATRYYWVRFVSQANVIGPYNSAEGTPATTATDPGLVLDSLTGQITESQLYSTLNSRIDQIDVGEDSLVTQVTSLNGQYTVKIDNAGLISGFGLASTTNNSTPTSDFGILANKFWIAPPAVAQSTAPTANLFVGYVWLDTSVTPNVRRYYNGANWTTTPTRLPFVINTTPQTINGVSAPAGVYIDSAFIRDGTITNAKIGNAAIDNAKIANLSASKLTAGSIQTGEYIQSINYSEGFSGWRIGGDGFAEFAASVIRGKLAASQIDTRGLSIFDDSGEVILSTRTKQTLRKVAFSGSLFAAVGDNGAACFSTDGVNWPSSPAGSTAYHGIAWDSVTQRFYAVGAGGTIISTQTGASWTVHTSPTSVTLRSVVRGGSALFAVGDGGTILTSTDGSTWQLVASGTTQSLNGIAWTGSLLVAVGAAGTILTSPTGATWTARTSGSTQTLTCAAFGASLIVVGGFAGVILTSADGVTWTSRSSGTTQAIRDIARGSSVFMAVGDSGVVQTSSNGTSWTTRSTSLSTSLLGVAWSLSTFAIVGSGGAILTSQSGTAFTNASESSFDGNVTGSVAGTNASTLVNTANSASSTANSAVAGLSTKLNNNAQNVLSGAGGIAVGSLTWDNSGVRTGGYGVGFSAKGIAAYNAAGAATFVLDGSDGSATFAGQLSAATGTFAGSLSAATGTFTGSLSAATGTFSGTLTANAINAVNTINISGNAVTIPASSSGVYSVSVTVSTDQAAAFSVIATFTQGSGRDGAMWQLFVNGTLLQQDNPRSGTLGAMSKLVSLSAGTHTFSFSSPLQSGDAFCGITVLGAKR